MNRRFVAGIAAAATLLVACGGNQNGTATSLPADTSHPSTTDVPTQETDPDVTSAADPGGAATLQVPGRLRHDPGRGLGGAPGDRRAGRARCLQGSGRRRDRQTSRSAASTATRWCSTAASRSRTACASSPERRRDREHDRAELHHNGFFWTGVTDTAAHT